MKKLFLFTTLALTLVPSVYANLLVTPTRVELDNKRDKSAVFSLVNKSSETSRYEIYLEDKRLLDSGEFELLESDVTPTSLTPFTRYSPRRVSLSPEQGARVRLAVRPPKDIQAGEYRSYIVFHQIPLAPTSETDANTPSDTMKLSVTAYLRIAIPVIMRVGQLTAELTIESNGLNTQDGKQQLIVEIAREGQRSSYGDVEVFDADTNELLGSLKNASIYTENERRSFAITLNEPLKPNTKLLVKYIENDGLFEAKTVEQTVNF
ncbi:molecular chaperone [Shewanella sp. TC10]|uniref:fimbrial biogenesis chaperone n=1 Tax=Shewanella sp. TC10 TaxID=1419739 RepID=UPI00129E89BA|nr:hypothetical protein [Shewanella sp. TC10]